MMDLSRSTGTEGGEVWPAGSDKAGTEFIFLSPTRCCESSSPCSIKKGLQSVSLSFGPPLDLRLQELPNIVILLILAQCLIVILKLFPIRAFRPNALIVSLLQTYVYYHPSFQNKLGAVNTGRPTLQQTFVLGRIIFFKVVIIKKLGWTLDCFFCFFR